MNINIKIRSRYVKDTPSGVSFIGVKSLAQQQFAAEADINNLVARYTRTGTFYDQAGNRVPQYGDFSSGEEYRDVQNRIAYAHEFFASLPSDVRQFHGNDVASFLDWIADPENKAEAQKMGLLPSEQDSPLDVTVPTDSPETENSENSETETE